MSTNVKAEKQQPDTKPKFGKDTYLFWYEQMYLMRRFEERAGQLYGMQKIKGFCHLYIGQEAVMAKGIRTARGERIPVRRLNA